MMRSSNLTRFLISIGRSFYSPEPYREAPRRPGRSFLVLLVVVVILFLPGFIRLAFVMGEIKRDYVDAAIYRLPVMEVINGRVSSPVSQPYELRVNGELLFVLDTTGKIGSLAESGAWAFMGSDHFAIYESEKGGAQRSFDFGDVDYVMFDPMSTKRWVDLVYPFLFPLFFIFSLAGIYIFRLVQALVLAAAVLLLLSTRRIKVGFDAVLAVAIQALIPSLCLETLLNLGGIYFPGRGWLLSALIVGYLWWGVRAWLSDRPETGETTQGFGPPI